MTKLLSRALTLPLVVLFSACGDDDVRTVDTFGTADTAAVAPGVAPAPGMADGMGSTISMQPLGGSGVSGEATLTESGQQTQVMVRLTGSQPNATHQGHIHQGTCDNLGSVVEPLQAINVDAQGTGTSTSTVNVPIHTVANGQHLVAYHAAGGSPGAAVVCGEIPAHGM